MQSYTLIAVVGMVAPVLLFEHMRWRRQIGRFAAVTGLSLAPPPAREASAARPLSVRERANRLYAMGEFGAAAELLLKSR